MPHTFIIFGLAEWTAQLPTNQHHLARQLVRRGHRVLFVDTVGTRRPKVAKTDLFRILLRLQKQMKGPVEVEPGIHRISPVGPPPGMHGAQRQLLQGFYARAVSSAVKRLGGARPIAWFFNPRASFMLKNEDLFGNIVFHAVDDLRLIPGANIEEIEEGERRLAERADLVLASAPPLYERLRAMAPDKTQYLPNVAEFEHFHAASHADTVVAPVIEKLPHPRIVFSGNLTASKIDYALLSEAIRQRPQWQWVLIGPVWEGEEARELEALRQLPNVRCTGHVAYENLPAYLAGADALIIPYRMDAATESVCPLKFWEYLATGKPVVATPLPALTEFGAEVPLAANAEEFVSALDEVLASSNSGQAALRRMALAQTHSWDQRIVEIEELLATVAPKKT